MRITLVSPGFPPMIGGGERYAHALAAELAERGHTITVVTSDAQAESHFWQGRGADGPPTCEAEPGMVVWRCATRGLPGGWRTLVGWRKAMVELSRLPGARAAWLERMAQAIPRLRGLEACLRALPPQDVIHGFNISWEGPLVAACREANERHTPYVVTPFTHLGRGLGDRVARNSTMLHQLAILRQAAGVLALTTVEADQLAGLGVAPERIAVAGAGLSPWQPYKGAEMQAALALPRAPYALFLGRGSRDKGVMLAMDAVAELQTRGMGLPLVVAGQPTAETLRHYHRLPPATREGVRLLGSVSEAHKHALLSRAAMLLLPSVVESFGIVVLEAWQHGLPVIAARAGGLPGLITDQVDGLLVEPGSPSALAAAIATVEADPGLAARLGAAGKACLPRHTWAAVAERVEQAYIGALSAR